VVSVAVKSVKIEFKKDPRSSKMGERGGNLHPNDFLFVTKRVPNQELKETHEESRKALRSGYKEKHIGAREIVKSSYAVENGEIKWQCKEQIFGRGGLDTRRKPKSGTKEKGDRQEKKLGVEGKKKRIAPDNRERN